MSKIPQKHLDFCREVAKLAAKNGVNRFSLNFRPGFEDEWRDEISANWESGRHGADMDQIRISSTVNVYDKVGLYEQS